MDNETTATRARILETAAVVFAEHGFAATTIRMICGRAQVNLAAVNYHFGNKEGLYREVLRYVRSNAYDMFPTTFGLSDDASPTQRLQAFIRSFLLRTSSDERNLGFGTLVMRELVQPTTALDMLIDEGIRNMFGQLVDIVRALIGEHAEEDVVLLCARSIISQCLFFLFSRPVIRRMVPEQKFNPQDMEILTEQIMFFSMHALKGISENRCTVEQPAL